MAVDLGGVCTVLLPGAGSDDDYIYRVFSGALHDAGAAVAAAAPRPGGLIAGYLADLDNAAADGPIAVGGISIGAAVAVTWALSHPGRAVAVLAALPAWTGSPEGAPAALAARQAALALRRDGLVAATAQMRASSPLWLADDLTRSWVGQWPALPDAMEEAAVDDPVHPVEVAVEWVTAAPRAVLRTVTLDEIGADPAVLGAACVSALREA